MRRPNVVKCILWAIFICSLFVGGLWLRRPVWLFNWQEFRKGNEIVSLVETFRTKNGRLPENLEEVGIKDPDLNVFYRKIGSNEYCVWFGTTLGESETYNSQSRKWE